MIPNFRGLTKGQTHRKGQRNTFIAPVALMVVVMLIGQAFWLSRNSHMFMPFEVSRVDCMECARLGTVRDPDDPRVRVMCPACFGVGYHPVRNFDAQDALCLACGGMGRLQTEAGWRTCRRCDGRGMHRIGDWREIVELEEMGMYDDTQPPASPGRTTGMPDASVDEEPETPDVLNAEHGNPAPVSDNH